MSIRLPRNLMGYQGAEPIDAIKQEIVQEMASSLGRATEAFEQALEGLAVFDRNKGGNAGENSIGHRETLLDSAGAALWRLVVQREACGLRNSEAVIRDYKVPAEIRLRMGVVRSRPRASDALPPPR